MDPKPNTDEVEAQVFAKHGIKPRQIYIDNDSRERAIGRRVMVLSVTKKADKAACASCSSDGKVICQTTWIKFERLANKKLFTLETDDYLMRK